MVAIECDRRSSRKRPVGLANDLQLKSNAIAQSESGARTQGRLPKKSNGLWYFRHFPPAGSDQNPPDDWLLNKRCARLLGSVAIVPVEIEH